VTDAALATAALLRHRASAGGFWVEASGGSMGRRYPPGTRLLVQSAARRPRPGQVWVFVDNDDRVVAHRYICPRNSDTLWFRGDASVRFDAPVDRARLVGPAVLVDDGTSRWSPRWWHAVRPSVGAGARGLLASRDRLYRRFDRLR
jgi:hypothetical protein